MLLLLFIININNIINIINIYYIYYININYNIININKNCMREEKRDNPCQY